LHLLPEKFQPFPALCFSLPHNQALFGIWGFVEKAEVPSPTPGLPWVPCTMGVGVQNGV
jgi:hypothetical protein